MLNIITNDNGAGLTKDAAVLSEFINHPCKRSQFGSRATREEVNVFCEVVSEDWINKGRVNILIPNPEWYHKKWLHLIPKFHEIWVKTREAERIFKELHPNVHYIGFTSEDHYDAEIEKEMEGFHACGKSIAKQTWLVLNTWEQWQPFPATVLTKLQATNMMFNNKQIDKKQYRAHGLNHINTQMRGIEQRQFNVMQNRALIHLCPSTYEGFGHYINEGRSCGAVVVTTDAAPMNELITKEFGFLLPCKKWRNRELGVDWRVEPGDFRAVIEKVANTPFDKLREMGKLARERFLSDREEFINRVNERVQVIL